LGAISVLLVPKSNPLRLVGVNVSSGSTAFAPNWRAIKIGAAATFVIFGVLLIVEGLR
jgi:hypothetical protein